MRRRGRYSLDIDGLPSRYIEIRMNDFWRFLNLVKRKRGGKMWIYICIKMEKNKITYGLHYEFPVAGNFKITIHLRELTCDVSYSDVGFDYIRERLRYTLSTLENHGVNVIYGGIIHHLDGGEYANQK